MPLPQRFWDKVELGEGGCWIWVGGNNGLGYGVFRWEGKQGYAHRISYSALVGPIPKGLTLDHLCQVRSCVRPDHLEPVTHKENCQRGKAATATHCPKGHPYTKENLYKHPNGGGRWCAACVREKAREYRARIKEKENG